MVDFLPPVAPLFVPASRPDRFHKADQSGADAIIFDLEDAVAPADKENARDAVIAQISGLKSTVIVRINAPGTPWHEADLEALARLKDVAIMLPKAERPEEITNAVRRINRSVPVIALVETAAGLARLPDLLSAKNVVMAAFGSVDFSLDLGCAHERLALLAARSELVWRSRAARRAAPLDGVTTDLTNPEVIKDDARHAVALGFGGKLASHPKQVEQIRQAYRPDEQTVAWARNIVAKTASGEAIQVNGEMVDRPVIERARLILSRATSET
ncbi:Citryl-CoA lyase [Agrobacterium deltaense Zutra 3/1]|uniref:Citryl-CoA lyase n=1 Tax=Agrobacterium deltaense Zutra 3/1 TaxID=1183427 RepID=A0A1S7R7S5_9HYPH|nr:CoA ester lyase [Agrobacterium deltaense]CUX48315.1 Citryl-CoA lyase [Agrobacterium deltaense Zutra 3/1]